MGREAAYDGSQAHEMRQGLVVRDESSRTHVYSAANPQEQTQRQLVTDMLDKVFDGSAAKLIMQALAATKTSPKELAEIRTLLDKHRGGRR
jgi:predicted transcriptional regulator